MAKGKAIRDVKGVDKGVPVVINQGNVSVLTVKLLNQINENLIGLRKDLQERKCG